MSSAGHVTSGSTTDQGTNSSDSERRVPTADDVRALREQHGEFGREYLVSRYRYMKHHGICNCGQSSRVVTKHKLKCFFRTHPTRSKGPDAITQGNEKHPKVIQYDLSGFPSRKLNPGASTPWLKKQYVRLPWTQGL